MNKLKFKYFAFDWDDNILHLNTKINLEKYVDNNWIPIEVSTTEFAEVRGCSNHRLPHINGVENADKAFQNFRDFTNENIFLNDCKDALKINSFGPSIESFKKCVINGHIFAIITARGHGNSNLREAVEYLIHNLLTRDEKNIMYKNLYFYQKLFDQNVNNTRDPFSFYLDNCQFIGVSSTDFINSVKKEDIPVGHNFTPKDTELGKQIAIKRFIKERISITKKLTNIEFDISIGFSDDDFKNIKSIVTIFLELKKEYNDIKYVLYDTSKNEDGTKNYNKIIV